MATPSFSDLVQDDLSCPVCFELLKDPNTPKELDCSHVCCVLCIQTMIKGGRPTVDCPECRNVTCIPMNGVAAMKTNFRLRSLADKHEEHMTKKKAKFATQHIDDPKKTKRNIEDARSLCQEHNRFLLYKVSCCWL